MTTLASLPTSLAKLFERIDAAKPSDPLLQIALEIWQARRDDKFLPAPADLTWTLPGEIALHSFLFRRPSEGAEWSLAFAGATAARHLGEPPAACSLSDLPARRLAVHLRHLVLLVMDTAEPISAIFDVPDGQHGKQRVEIVMAPLSTNQRQVDAIFGSLVARTDRSA